MTGAAEGVPQKGTPEYDAEYDKAFNKQGDGAASGASGDDSTNSDSSAAGTKPSTTDDDQGEVGDATTGEGAGDDQPDPELADLKQQNQQLLGKLQNAEKALKDTQKWGHGLAVNIRELRKAITEIKRGERPAILDEMPDLEKGLDYLLSSKQPADDKEDGLDPPKFDFTDASGTDGQGKPDPVQQWTQTVMEGCPKDLDRLLQIPDFDAKVKARRTELGAQWANPVVAIREFNTLYTEWVRQEAVQTAERKARQRKNMHIPEGGAGNAGSGAEATEKAAYDAVMNEPKEKFQQRRAKTLGYSG